MKEKKLFRSFDFKVKEASDDGKVGWIEGYASTFGNTDLGLDIVDPGAFTKTIKDKDGKFPILLDHNPYKPIGWNVEASEDNYGLSVKGEIQLITEEAKNRYQLAKRAKELGTKMGLSIGYSTIKAEPGFHNPMIRHLKELKLWEYSLVVFPMNEMAGIDSAKQVKHLFDLLKQGGYPADVFKALADLGIKEPAAEPTSDPALIQSVDQLIQAMKG